MKSLKNEAVRLQNFELAASYRDKEKEYTNQLDTLKEEWEKSLKENRETVDDEQIAEVVSMMSGVPCLSSKHASFLLILQGGASRMRFILGLQYHTCQYKG